MKYHRFMFATYLCLSAATFKAASWLLGRALKHNKPRTKSSVVRQYAPNVINFKAPVVDPADTVGYVTADDEGIWEPSGAEEYKLWFAEHLINGGIGKSCTWTDAEPCSDFDPMHPDYIDSYPTK